MEPALVILAIIVLVPLIYVLAQYNSLVALRNHIREAWSNIDTELKRRYDLIPNLVSTVKGYAKHEREVLERVVELRNTCMQNHGDVVSQAADEKQLVEGIQKMIAVAESYPDLKADSQYVKLQEELVNTEDRIQASRRFFNGNVRDYRIKCQAFPSNLVANAFGFKPEEYFSVDSSVREVPSTEF